MRLSQTKRQRFSEEALRQHDANHSGRQSTFRPRAKSEGGENNNRRRRSTFRPRADSEESEGSRGSFEFAEDRIARRASEIYASNRPSPQQFCGPVQLFIELGDALYQIAYGSRHFEAVILVAILAASAGLALQVRPLFPCMFVSACFCCALSPDL